MNPSCCPAWTLSCANPRHPSHCGDGFSVWAVWQTVHSPQPGQSKQWNGPVLGTVPCFGSRNQGTTHPIRTKGPWTPRPPSRLSPSELSGVPTWPCSSAPPPRPWRREQRARAQPWSSPGCSEGHVLCPLPGSHLTSMPKET